MKNLFHSYKNIPFIRSSFHLCLMALAAFLFMGKVLAHDDQYFDSQVSPHAGQIRMAGIYHFELVLDKNAVRQNNQANQTSPIMVYVTDHAGKALPTNGATATLTIVQGSHKVSVNLSPDGENRLKGQASYAKSANLKAVLSVSMQGQEAQQARFTPFAIVKKSAAPAHHH